MPKTVTVERTLYTYDELSEKAQERAREKYREHQYVHYEFNYDDFVRIAELMGITIDTRTGKYTSGRAYTEPCIWWSGFSSQGDGACFEGKYYGAYPCLEAVKAHAPEDKTLHGIASVLDQLQAKYNGELRAVIKHSGHYYHKYCTDIEVERDSEDPDWTVGQDDEKALVSEFRDLMQWMYDALEREHDYQTSDDTIAQHLSEYDYTFDASGNRLDEDDL